MSSIDSKSFNHPIFKILVTFVIFVSIMSSLIDFNETNIEEDAGQYFKEIGTKDSVKLIGAERVGYYAGLSMIELNQASNPNLHDTKFVIYQGNIQDADKILGPDYQIDKIFTKNNQGIFIFKKSNDAK